MAAASTARAALLPLLLPLLVFALLLVAVSWPGLALAPQLRAALAPLRDLVSPPPCRLGELCGRARARAPLPDGLPSSPVWDLPRHLMAHAFTPIQRLIPAAKVSYMWEEPLVVYYDDVLTDEELDLIVNAATPRFKKSMVVDANGNPQEDTSRTSDTAWIYQSEDPAYKAIVQKVAALTGFSAEHAEPIGVNRYQPSQYFNPHHDFLKEEQLQAAGNFVGCQRASTILIYLSDVEEGGESVFVRNGHMDGRFQFDVNNPDHLAVKPKRGRVLVWYDMHPYTERVDHRTLHGGSPVKKGTKLAATVFIRNCTKTPRNNVSAKEDL